MKLDGERFLQALNGRFLRFAPVSYVSPQKSSNIHAIYYVNLVRRNQKVIELPYGNNRSPCSNARRIGLVTCSVIWFLLSLPSREQTSPQTGSWPEH